VTTSIHRAWQFNKGRQTTSPRSAVAQGPCSAFTLLEVLLAVSVFALIAVIIGGAMRLGYRSQEKGEKRIESTERLRRTAEVVTAQIESFVPLTFDEDGETKAYFQGDRKALTLPTNYSLWVGSRGYVVAEYSVRAEAGKESLYVAEHTVGTAGKNETLLLPSCERIEFAYYMKGLTVADDAWVEQWTETGSPEKVRITFTYLGRDYALTVPLRARGATTT
jgi:prepilin-type N-terminal cleavage/methylation domain-containing protein